METQIQVKKPEIQIAENWQVKGKMSKIAKKVLPKIIEFVKENWGSAYNELKFLYNPMLKEEIALELQKKLTINDIEPSIYISFLETSEKYFYSKILAQYKNKILVIAILITLEHNLSEIDIIEYRSVNYTVNKLLLTF